MGEQPWHKNNETLVGEAYGKASRATTWTQTDTDFPYDYVYEWPDARELVEITCSEHMLEDKVKWGSIEVGINKLRHLEDCGARFFYCMRSEADVDNVIVFEMRFVDWRSCQQRMDDRPGRDPEVLYRIPLKHFSGLVVNGELLRIPAKDFQFNRSQEKKEETSIGKLLKNQGSWSTGKAARPPSNGGVPNSS